MSKPEPVKSKALAKSFPRAITRNLKVNETTEGIGLRIRRFIGNREVRCLPPFVICEQFRMDETGRPPHPSRGSQKITFVLSGKIRVDYSSEDSIELGPGDVTSLMVGRGVIRSINAVPDKDASLKANHGLLKSKKAIASGMQIYMDVPEPFKRMKHSHLNLCQSDIVSVEPSEGCVVRILTGSVFGKKADQMLTATPALILDVELKPGSSVDVPVRSDWNAFAYLIDGKAWIQGEKTNKSQYVEFMRSSRASSGYNHAEASSSSTSSESSEEASGEDEMDGEPYVSISVDASATSDARILFCAAKPLSQPIYRQGPFIDVSMNWIHQAFDDYTTHKNGFESNAWKSRPVISNAVRSASNTPSIPNYTERPDPLPVLPQTKSEQQHPSEHPSEVHEKSQEETPAFNPCDVDACDSTGGGDKQNKKASNPNAFPPGSVNPASFSTAFSADKCVEEQQEQMLPQKSDSAPNSVPKRGARHDADDSDASETTVSPPPSKKRN